MKNKLTKQEISLLLYVETCCVDHDGKLDTTRINDEDRDILSKWNDLGYVYSGRLPIDIVQRDATMWVFMSNEAIGQAATERKARQDRGIVRLFRQLERQECCAVRNNAIGKLQKRVEQIESKED